MTSEMPPTIIEIRFYVGCPMVAHSVAMKLLVRQRNRDYILDICAMCCELGRVAVPVAAASHHNHHGRRRCRHRRQRAQHLFILIRQSIYVILLLLCQYPQFTMHVLCLLFDSTIASRLECTTVYRQH